LPLEAMLLQLGAFGPEVQGEVHELAYWKLSGGREPGEVISLWGKKKDDQRAATEAASFEAHAALLDLVRRFDNPEQPYLSAPDPKRDQRFSDYAQLARRSEWAAAEDEE
jgi:ATP-dependent helicase/nuclease subunit B